MRSARSLGAPTNQKVGDKALRIRAVQPICARSWVTVSVEADAGNGPSLKMPDGNLLWRWFGGPQDFEGPSNWPA